MAVTSISDYDIENGKLTMSGYLSLKWTDELLYWKENDFGGVNRIIVSRDDVWVPELKQAAKTELAEHFFVSSVWISNNGTACMILAGDFIGYCNVNTLYFPIDKQSCYFAVLSTANDAGELLIDFLGKEVETKLLAQHGEWDIENSNVSHMSFYDYDLGLKLFGCLFKINLSRRPLSILIYTCLPLTLIAFLNVMIYVVPVASGERVSFSVQILLTLIFFTSTISNRIPQNAIEIPLLSRAMAVLTLLCSLNVMISVELSRVANEYIKPVSGCLKSFTRLFLYFKLRRRYKYRGEVRNVAGQDENGEDATDKEKSNKMVKQAKVKETAEDIDITWMMVVDMFDSIIFYVHLFIVLSGTVAGGLYISGVI